MMEDMFYGLELIGFDFRRSMAQMLDNPMKYGVEFTTRPYILLEYDPP